MGPSYRKFAILRQKIVTTCGYNAILSRDGLHPVNNAFYPPYLKLEETIVGPVGFDPALFPLSKLLTVILAKVTFTIILPLLPVENFGFFSSVTL